MSDDKPPVLNLDELFGQRQDIRVRWGNQEYFLRAPEDLGPAELVALQRLDIGSSDGAELGAAVAGVLRIISPELAAQNLPFVAQVRVLQHYIQFVPVSAPKARPARAGGRSSRGSRSGTASASPK